MPKENPQLSAADILSITDNLRCDNYINSLDKAELARHFGGGSLNPDCDNLGLVGDQNWLLGYKYLNQAFRQIFGLYTSDAGIVDIKVKKALTPERRRYVERVANRRVNQVIKESRRFRYPYWATCGDAVIYGSPYLFKWNKYDWCPTYAGTPLMPRTAPADVNDPAFMRWAFPSELTGQDIIAQLKRAERTKGGSGWHVQGLRNALRQLTKELDPNQAHLYNVDWDLDEPEQIEYKLEVQAQWQTILGTSVKVYYFFQKDQEGKVDVYVVNRLAETVSGSSFPSEMKMSINRSGEGETMLFFQRARFDSVNECLWPMILDTKFGGKPLAYRVLGLGRLNYDLDRKVSELINAGFAGITDDMTPLYQAADIGAMTKLEQMMANGLRRGSVLPPDVSAFEKPKNQRNMGNILSFMGVMDVAQGQNAASQSPNQGGQGRNELEVVALERQAQNQQNVTARMEDWVDMGQPMAEAMVTALTGKGKMAPGDRGWPERERLTELLQEDGVLLEELDPALVTVSLRKHLGAGDNALRLQRAERKMGVRHLYPPESQVMILREWTEALDNSFERANELVPQQPEQNPVQQQAAALQTSLALASGTPPPVNGTDMPLIHAPLHLQSAVGVIQTSQGGLDPSAQNGLSALLEHAMADIQMIEIGGDKATADALMQQLQEIARAAQEISSPPPVPKEVHDMQMKERNAALQEAKHQTAVEKFQLQQQHRQEVDQFNQDAKLQDLALKERAQALDEETELGAQAVANQV